jgi:hypothetical protein
MKCRTTKYDYYVTRIFFILNKRKKALVVFTTKENSFLFVDLTQCIRLTTTTKLKAINVYFNCHFIQNISTKSIKTYIYLTISEVNTCDDDRISNRNHTYFTTSACFSHKTFIYTNKKIFCSSVSSNPFSLCCYCSKS